MKTRGPEWVFDDSPIDDPFGYGQRAVDAIRALRHPKSNLPGQPFQLDPPFERIVRRIYGPRDERGGRIVRTVYFQVGRGSRKTTFAAALALLHTVGPERVPGGENLLAAADRKQAGIAYREAEGIIKAHGALATRTKIRPSAKRITHYDTGAFLEAISSDADTQHGRTPVFSLVDELWAHRKRDLWEAIRTGAAKVPGSLIVVTTTAGRGTESPDYPLLEYGRKVQAGEIDDPAFLPIIFEAPSDCPWDDEAVWRAALPGLEYGYPDIGSLRQLAREAANRPGDRESFQQFFLGIRQENSLSPFVDMTIFDQGRADLDPAELEGFPCWIAVDMSSTTDLTGVVAVFATPSGLVALSWAFVPADNLQRKADRDQAPYPRWAQEGWIIATPGSVIDPGAVEAHIRGLSERFEVQEILFDPAYAAAVMSPLLEDGLPVATMRQGWVTQSPALNELERHILGRNLKWDSPVLRWCLANVSIHTDTAGNRTMHKGKSRDRIDLAVCLWMAVSRAAAGEVTGGILEDEAFDPARFFVDL